MWFRVQVNYTAQDARGWVGALDTQTHLDASLSIADQAHEVALDAIDRRNRIHGASLSLHSIDSVFYADTCGFWHVADGANGWDLKGIW